MPDELPRRVTQKDVDAAFLCLMLDAFGRHGLLQHWPNVDMSRCADTLRLGVTRGRLPDARVAELVFEELSKPHLTVRPAARKKSRQPVGAMKKRG
jgi:hypothetical protein